MRKEIRCPLYQLYKAPHSLSLGHFSRFFLLCAALFGHKLGLFYMETILYPSNLSPSVTSSGSYPYMSCPTQSQIPPQPQWGR